MKSFIVLSLSLSAIICVCFGDSTVFAVGALHTCFNDSGQMKCWGYGVAGQLGTGSTSSGISPNQITAISFASSLGKVTNVRAGTQHSCALFDSGKLVCFGINLDGSLGIGSQTYAGCGGSCLSTIQLTGIGFADPTVLVSAVSPGGYHSCALFTNGKVRW
jgi:hypothetical protein